ncbi:DHS-like NAD/FAD-binding domain-containing protein [Flagelloscypha sp. PMI_526]|nr:DHS-like NAD/FAD-binding domain-containing protein [Flagelloscypha sp. PMI_526]
MAANRTLFQEVLRESKHVVAVCGAGLSAGSGVPTFRGAGGYWRSWNAMEIATPEAFEENPARTWKFYHYRRETALKVNPNQAHYALAMMSSPSIRKQMAPNAQFTLITQNCRWIEPTRFERDYCFKVGKMIEMHGRLHDVICSNYEECDWKEWNTSSPICEVLRGTEGFVGDEKNDQEIPVKDLPHCPKCGKLARPGVVWFGESIPALERIYEVIKTADLCLVVGTSSTVYPAAGLASDIQETGGKVAIFNIESTPGDERAEFRFLGKCEEELPKALGLAD